ncbi:MAG: hypothetical protein ACJA0G_000617 [Kangiellaceae bacterium]|jgi:hypothetical protein
MDVLVNLYEQTNGLALSLIVALVLLVWFLPAILALFFNPRHAKLIALACIPAGLSFIAWGALILWATTGKVVDRFRGKVEGKGSPHS